MSDIEYWINLSSWIIKFKINSTSFASFVSSGVLEDRNFSVQTFHQKLSNSLRHKLDKNNIEYSKWMSTTESTISKLSKIYLFAMFFLCCLRFLVWYFLIILLVLWVDSSDITNMWMIPSWYFLVEKFIMVFLNFYNSVHKNITSTLEKDPEEINFLCLTLIL